jgi:hypothetical protein
MSVVKKTVQSHDEVVSKIVNVSLRSALATEICIFELQTLSDLISQNDAESIRKEFVAHNTPIRQITNHRQLASWTSNEEMIQNLRVKYVSPENLLISDEILIFDDTVAIYCLEPTPIYFEITDSYFAAMMQQVFTNTWAIGDTLLLTNDGSTYTKQYLPISYRHKEIPVIIYPAKDDGKLELAFSRSDIGCLEKYIDSLLKENESSYRDADIIVTIIWNQKDVPHCDIWKINRNKYSDDSGFLYDVQVYKNLLPVSDMGVASGNTSIVITAEEMLLRELILKNGLSFSQASDRKIYQAKFPAGFVPAENFYQEDRTISNA